MKKAFGLIILTLTLCAAGISAQTTAFTYQGRLTDGASAANGAYDLGFELFDAAAGGNQIGPAQTRRAVNVSNGVFTVQLDFGANPFTSGANRFLEILVKRPADANYTTLTPRQQLTSSPFSVQSLNAMTANDLSAACVACVTNAQINSVFGSKIIGTVADATNAATAENVTGIVAIANGGTGSATQNFVDLTTAQIIAGNKTFTGTISGTLADNTVGSAQITDGSLRLSDTTVVSRLVKFSGGGGNTTQANSCFEQITVYDSRIQIGDVAQLIPGRNVDLVFVYPPRVVTTAGEISFLTCNLQNRAVTSSANQEFQLILSRP